MAALQEKIKAKDAVELSIRTLMGTLGAVGMHEPLVDGEAGSCGVLALPFTCHVCCAQLRASLVMMLTLLQ